MRGRAPLRIGLLLFDLDGTLVDTVEDIWRSTNVMRRGMDLAPLSLRRVRSYIGRGMRRFAGEAIPPSARHRTDEAMVG